MFRNILSLALLVFIAALPSLAEEVPQKIYIAGPFGTSISRVNLDGTSPELLIPGVKTPSDILLRGGRIYWSDLDSGDIISMNVDGTDPRFEMVPGNGVGTPYCFDFSGEVFYWCESIDRIRSGTFDSLTPTVITTNGVASPFPRGARISEEFNRLYWADENNNLLHVVDLGTNTSTVLSTDVGGRGLAMNHAAKKIYITAPETIWVLDLPNGTNKTALFTNTGSEFSSIAVDADSGLLFVIDESDGRIYRLDENGNGFSAITPAYPDLRAVGVDDSTKQLYFSDAAFSEIYRTDYNGFGTKAVVPRIFGEGTREVEIDEAERALYLSQAVPPQILKVDLIGKSTELFQSTLIPGAKRIQIFDGRFYWIDLNGEKLQSIKLDGTDLQLHATSKSTMLSPFSAMLSFVVSDSSLYWIDSIPSTSIKGKDLFLYRSHRDGSEVTEIQVKSPGLYTPGRMRVDDSRGVIFVRDVNLGGSVPLIQRLELNTGEISTYLTGGGVGDPRQFNLQTQAGLMYYLESSAAQNGIYHIPYDSSEATEEFLTPITGTAITLALDRCPDDSLKTEPGACGCDFQELVVNNIPLCGLDTSEQKYLRLVDLLRSLRRGKAIYDAQLNVRAEVQALFDALDVDLALSTDANTPKGLKRRQRAGAKLGRFLAKRSPNFGKRKKKAIRAILKLKGFVS